MSKIKFYTKEEAQAKLIELFKAGKGLFALKDDPKCPPELKTKLAKLSKLQNQHSLEVFSNKAKKGGGYEA